MTICPARTIYPATTPLPKVQAIRVSRAAAPCRPGRLVCLLGPLFPPVRSPKTRRLPQRPLSPH